MRVVCSQEFALFIENEIKTLTLILSKPYCVVYGSSKVEENENEKGEEDDDGDDDDVEACLLRECWKKFN